MVDRRISQILRSQIFVDLKIKQQNPLKLIHEKNNLIRRRQLNFLLYKQSAELLHIGRSATQQ